MRRTVHTPLILAALAAACPLASAQVVLTTPAGTAFTYQGRLEDNGQAMNSPVDLEFRLYTGSTPLHFQIGSPVVVEDVPVSNGLFTAKVDFGPVFTGRGRWLSIGIRPGASAGAFTPLSQRQELTPSPYAVGLALPYAGSSSDDGPLVTLDNLGTSGGGAMALSSASGITLTVANTNGDAIAAAATANGNGVNATSTGAGAALRGANNGTGSGVYGQISGVSSPAAAAVYGYGLGSNGFAGFFRTESTTNPSNAVEVQGNGYGYALHVTARTNHSAVFESTSPSGISGGLLSTVAGDGIPVWGKTSGSSPAGRFDINSPSSTASALEVYNAGSGLTAKFSGGDVQVNGNLYAQAGTVLNRATPIGWGTFDTGSPPTLVASSGNVVVTYVNGKFRVQLVGEGSPDSWTVIAVPRYGNDPEASATEYLLRVGAPLAVVGQPGTGAFYISERCINGCDEFVLQHWINFVVYKGQ